MTKLLLGGDRLRLPLVEPEFRELVTSFLGAAAIPPEVEGSLRLTLQKPIILERMVLRGLEISRQRALAPDLTHSITLSEASLADEATLVPSMVFTTDLVDTLGFFDWKVPLSLQGDFHKRSPEQQWKTVCVYRQLITQLKMRGEEDFSVIGGGA